MTAALALPSIHYVVLLPEFILSAAAVLLLAATSVIPGGLPRRAGTVTVVVACLAVVGDCIAQWVDVSRHGPSLTIAHAVVEDGFGIVAIGIVAVSLGLSVLVCDGWLERAGITGVSLHVLVLASATGAVLMAQANDLVVIFLGLEILSIGLYVLAAFDRRSARGGEAALKYFLLGGFASAIFVYGIALIYGASGTTQLGQLADFLATHVLKNDGLLLAGTAFVLIGFAFKVAAVPFHVWSPDVYEGSPTPVVGYMASVVKVGAFCAVLRVLASALYTQQSAWRPMVVALAVLSMLVGAVLALLQRNVKRMLAYSSVSHGGFVLLGLWAATPRGTSAALYYLAAYALMVVGTFAVVTVVSGDGAEDLADYRGLAVAHPWLAGSLTVLLLAQAGVPFTTGFLAKLGVIEAAISQLGAVGATLGAIAMVATAIGAYFYLRVVVLTYDTRQLSAQAAVPAVGVPAVPAELAVPLARLGSAGATLLLDAPAPSTGTHGEAAGVAAASPGRASPWATSLVIACCVVPTVVLGIWAGPLVDLAHRATTIFHP